MTGFDDQSLGGTEVRARAVSGAKAVAARGVAVRAIAFVGSLVLARFLTPSEFGLVAVGSTLIAFAMFMADGGLGAALIRRSAPPTRLELESLLGLQLSILLSVVALTAAVAPFFERAGLVSFVMVASMPIVAFQSPGAIMLERNLRYGPRVAVELVEATVFTSSAIVLVAFGAGVWGVVAATWLRGIAGATAMQVVSPVRVLRPRWSFAHIRGLVAFGAKYQAVGAVNLVRDQGLNLVVVSVGGLSMLGLWSLVQRVLQVPGLIFESLWRVSYPAMSRIQALGEDPASSIRRMLSLISVAAGLVLVPMVGAGPSLLGAVFGAAWAPATAVIPPAALGLMVAGPVSVAAAGYLYAKGDTGTILRATVLHTVVWLGVTSLLLNPLGIEAVGYGWMASGLVEAVVIGRSLRRASGVNAVSPTWRSTTLAIASAAVGMLTSMLLPPGLFSIICGAGVALALYLLGLLLVDRAPIVRLAALAVRGRSG